MTKLDLGYGNPGFLQEQWENHNLIKEIESKSFMPYKHGKNIFPQLEEIIKALHIKHQNAQINPNTKIVITVGAVQALQAAMSSFKHLNKQDEIFVPKPFWGRFNDFINQSQLTKVLSSETAIKLITSPNNPNGVDQSHLAADIRDACYNWKHYTPKVSNFSDEIVVFSLSKLSGHSSTRIGWAVVQDEEKAEYMKNYVNIYTSGVSVEAQLNANAVLQDLYKNDSFFNNAAEVLNQRYNEIKNILDSKQLGIEILSTQGMFLYLNCKPQLISDLNIVYGESKDYEDPQINNFRLNLGVDSETYTEFISRLKAL